MKNTLCFVFASLILFWSIFPATLDAQDQTRSVTSEQIRDMARTTSVPDMRTVTVEGSPFLSEDFANGSIVLSNNRTTNVLPLRYNAYEGSLQFREGQDIFSIADQDVKEFELYLSDRNIKFKKGFSADRLDPDKFVALMTDGEASFIVLFSKNLREDISGYGQATQVQEYTDSNEFFVKFGDNSPDRLRSLSGRRVLRSFPSHRDQLERYSDHNNLQLDQIVDVAKLFSHYNSLLEE